MLKIKRYKEALADTKQALLIDPAHLKSLHRHVTALYFTKDFKSAKRKILDMMGLGLDTESLAEIMKNCNERLNQIRFEAMEKLKRSAFFIDFSSSLKVHVTEINVD